MLKLFFSLIVGVISAFFVAVLAFYAFIMLSQIVNVYGMNVGGSLVSLFFATAAFVAYNIYHSK
jgi:hypothetical protein